MLSRPSVLMKAFDMGFETANTPAAKTIDLHSGGAAWQFGQPLLKNGLRRHVNLEGEKLTP